jgi:iron(II)-dependent oxidoreductase
MNLNLRVKQIRLPLDAEWTAAAGGDIPNSRYPWDAVGKVTQDEKEIARHANVANNVGHTTPVNAYLRGASLHGVMDMAGNVWEWEANYHDMKKGWLSLRAGSWGSDGASACVSIHYDDPPHFRNNFIGFRVALLH